MRQNFLQRATSMSDILAERHLRARDPPSLGVADRLPGGGRLLLGRRTAFLISLGGGRRTPPPVPPACRAARPAAGRAVPVVTSSQLPHMWEAGDPRQATTREVDAVDADLSRASGRAPLTRRESAGASSAPTEEPRSRGRGRRPRRSRATRSPGSAGTGRRPDRSAPPVPDGGCSPRDMTSAKGMISADSSSGTSPAAWRASLLFRTVGD